MIKTTGGNKMTIFDVISESKYKCMWFVGSLVNESIFNEDDIVTLDDYKRYLRIEERDDKINKLLS